MECAICCDKFTASLRKEVNCPHCNNDICVSCTKRYLLESAKDPHCPYCSKGWNRFFLQQNLPKSFIDHDYAKRRADILWGREESYIPEIQPKAVRVQKSEEYTRDKIVPLTGLMKQLREKEVEIRKALRDVENEFYVRKAEALNILNGTSNIPEDLEDSSSKESSSDSLKSGFRRKCNHNECLGWLSSAWKCSLCENYTCPDCFKVIGKKRKEDISEDGTTIPHVCNSTDVETANLIKTSTKPCPKCGEAIEKGEGCDVMFCTSCHTGFNWVTGKILQDTQIHNPHYFEWQAKMGNQVNENYCGQRLGGFMVNRVAPTLRTQFGKIIRIIMHVEDIEFQNYNYHLNHQNNEDLVIDYLLKKKEKEDIKRNIQNRERRIEREKAIRDILETFVMAGKEQVYMILQDSKKTEIIFETIEKLKEYINKSLGEIGRLYGCQVPMIKGWDSIEYINPQKKVKDTSDSKSDETKSDEIPINLDSSELDLKPKEL